jgi:hypothetical protein
MSQRKWSKKDRGLAEIERKAKERKRERERVRERERERARGREDRQGPPLVLKPTT